MTAKKPEVQRCGERHAHYLHCLICNPPPAERPGMLQGPEVGSLVLISSKYGAESLGLDGRVGRVTERSYVWAPGDPSYRGGSRRYDWKVVEWKPGKSMVLDDSDLTTIEVGMLMRNLTEVNS